MRNGGILSFVLFYFYITNEPNNSPAYKKGALQVNPGLKSQMCNPESSLLAQLDLRRQWCYVVFAVKNKSVNLDCLNLVVLRRDVDEGKRLDRFSTQSTGQTLTTTCQCPPWSPPQCGANCGLRVHVSVPHGCSGEYVTNTWHSQKQKQKSFQQVSDQTSRAARSADRKWASRADGVRFHASRENVFVCEWIELNQ